MAASGGDEGAAAGKPRRVSLLWQMLILLIGVLVLAHNGLSNDHQGVGSGYMNLGIDPSRCGPDGFCEITGGRVSRLMQGVREGAAVAPEGPLAKAGVRAGDALRLDRGMDLNRRWSADETVGATLRRGGASSHIVIRAGARPPMSASHQTFAFGLDVAANSLTCLIGMLVTLRSRRRTSTLLFGAALVCLAPVSSDATLAESAPWLFPMWVGLLAAVFCSAPVLLLAFAVAVRREAGGRPARTWALVLVAYAATQAIFWGYGVSANLTSRQLFGGAVDETWFAINYLGYGLALFGLFQAWRESRGQDRPRFAFMLLASGLMAASNVFGFAINLTGNNFTLNNPLFLLMLIGPTAGAAVFAYAVLRHRVFDLGFAVNRTLVYGAVSAILLAAFGLSEWAIDHFVPIAGREKNAVIDAAIAVGVFLTFHRVRDVVEHGVEGLFFRRWQQAEAAFRRFVREAAFVTEPAALTRAFAKALSDYAEGAQAAVYLADQRRYHRTSGEVAGVVAQLDADLSVLVRLRADLKPVEVDDSAFGAALIAPMVNRNEVIGAVVLGPRPSGLAFRPDEIELIGWATRQVGLDLHALKVERLEASEADLRKTVVTLERALSLKSATV